jgi:hypothetical protein
MRTSTEAAGAALLRDGYAVLPRLLAGPALDEAYRHARAAASGPLARVDDKQSLGTPSVYGDPVMDTLLAKLGPVLERLTGLSLLPTYSYFRVYRHGDSLFAHTDRPACEISVSLSLGYSAPASWPLVIQGLRGDPPFYARLEAGDALLYLGPQCAHWRDRFDGEHAAQLFLHYVRSDGDNAHLKFDRRAALAGGAGSDDVPEVIRSLEIALP